MLDEVKAGTRLQDIAGAHAMDDIVRAVADAKTALRHGLAALDDDALTRRAGIEPWTIAQVIGHALVADANAHRIARSLAIGVVPPPGMLAYDEPGRVIARDALLAGIAEAEARLGETRVLASGGPRYEHRDLGPLDARGWILFIALHDALHLHQAAAIARTPR